MKLHLIGLFHTQHNLAHSHCAFTGKALRFPKMMIPHGYEIVEYSNEGSESLAQDKVQMLSVQELKKFFKRKDSDFFGDNAVVGCRGHEIFEERLIEALRTRVTEYDIICHPFGHAHEKLLSLFPRCFHVETGIGYPTLMKGSYRIFESYAWMHYHQGKEGRNGTNFEWVIPNYFDLEDWEPSYKAGDYIAFLGRVCQVKGMDTVLEIAKRTDKKIRVAGQGDIGPWEHPNIEFLGPISGRERSEFLRNASCAIMPSVFTEPFAGSGVEAMLCGTPLIAVDYGAFTETVMHGVTGFRCHVLSDWLEAINEAPELSREYIARRARSLYSLEACGRTYDKVFRQLQTLVGEGWYVESY
jgi:glycosyltransferase involved in cell wall biosynthesis